MKKAVRSRKYFAPQNQDEPQKCDHPGCCNKGEYKAPKDRSLKEYYWFCLEHVQEYNLKWNYFSGVEEKEEEEEVKKTSRMRFRNFNSKIRYNFGYDIEDDFGIFGEYSSDFARMDESFYNQEEKSYLKIMELSVAEINLEALKKQYKKLVKKYHPDLNQGDKMAEEKFKQLSNAYKCLLKKLEAK